MHDTRGLPEGGEEPFFACERLTTGEQRREYLSARDALMLHAVQFPLDIAPEAMNSVLLAVLDDNPQLFWFEGAWSAATIDGAPYVVPRYTADATSAACMARELEQVVEALIANLTAESPQRVLLCLYDWMLQNVRYGTPAQGQYGQTAYEALVQRIAVCKGIAKAYQLLLSRVGVPSALVKGSIGGVGRHVWNVVRVGGVPYYVDISLAHRRFDCYFTAEERDNPRRCFLMDRDTVLRHGVTFH